MFGKLTEQQIEEVLRDQIVGRIGCHYDGVTYVFPISYAYDGDAIYCHTKEGMKMKLMRNNSRVCFQVDDMQNMANWKSVIAWGDFEELDRGNARRDAIRHLMKRSLPIISSETTHLAPSWPFYPEDLDEIPGIVFRIRLDAKTGRFEKSEPVNGR